MLTNNILQGFWASPGSLIQLMPQPSPLPLKAPLQVAIAHHGIVPNNLDLVPTLINISLQQLIATTINIPPTIDAPTFADPMGKFF